MIESHSGPYGRASSPLGMVQRSETPLSAATKPSATQYLCNLQ